MGGAKVGSRGRAKGGAKARRFRCHCMRCFIQRVASCSLLVWARKLASSYQRMPPLYTGVRFACALELSA